MHAALRPVSAATGRMLAAALDRAGGTLDDSFEDDITAATALLTTDEGAPWSDA